MTPGEAQFQYTYVISPIFLEGGAAASFPFGKLPIAAFTQAGGFSNGLLSPITGEDDLDQYFAHFSPLPGSQLISQDIGTYPFANQQTAANAILTKPLNVSMLMYCPARAPGGYVTKSAVLSGIQATLAQHNISGGTYTIVTPGFTWTNCVMIGMQDTSGSEVEQVQWRWQLDFQKPLVSLQDAQAAKSNLYAQIANGQQVSPDASGLLTTAGSGIATAVPGDVSASSVLQVPAAASNPAASGIPSGDITGGFYQDTGGTVI